MRAGFLILILRIGRFDKIVYAALAFIWVRNNNWSRFTDDELNREKEKEGRRQASNRHGNIVLGVSNETKTSDTERHTQKDNE